MSKDAFKRYNADIIEASMDRVSTVRIFDVFMYDDVLSVTGGLSKFHRVKTLILENIQSECLEDLVNQLPTLSLLSSLTISTIDDVKNRNSIYQRILRLSALKYCQLSLLGWSNYDSLPVSTNEYSPIERLIITNSVYSYELDSLLSYIPQLRRLSIYSLSRSWYKRTEISPHILNDLTHLSLTDLYLNFDEFETMMINIFHTIRVLFVTVYRDADLSYLDANRWEELITSHLPNLRIFDIQLTMLADSADDKASIKTKMNEFTSSFWAERQWFFSSKYYRARYGRRALLYSTNSYRYC